MVMNKKSDVIWLSFWSIVFLLIIGWLAQWVYEIGTEIAFIFVIFGSILAYGWIKLFITWEEVESRASGPKGVHAERFSDNFQCSKCGQSFKRLYDLQWHNCPNDEIKKNE